MGLTTNYSSVIYTRYVCTLTITFAFSVKKYMSVFAENIPG